jgi:hypothetical protein
MLRCGWYVVYRPKSKNKTKTKNDKQQEQGEDYRVSRGVDNEQEKAEA